ncbi:MAG: hypothetical protein AAF937_07750, partial [Planctomycetota bacterium]
MHSHAASIALLVASAGLASSSAAQQFVPAPNGDRTATAATPWLINEIPLTPSELDADLQGSTRVT